MTGLGMPKHVADDFVQSCDKTEKEKEAEAEAEKEAETEAEQAEKEAEKEAVESVVDAAVRVTAKLRLRTEGDLGEKWKDIIPPTQATRLVERVDGLLLEGAAWLLNDRKRPERLTFIQTRDALLTRVFQGARGARAAACLAWWRAANKCNDPDASERWFNRALEEMGPVPENLVDSTTRIPTRSRNYWSMSVNFCP